MILGTGIDSVDIHRFKDWYAYPHTKLSRIFSQQEIAYCLIIKNKSAERFAARFAAREAFFKAFTAMQPDHSIPFLTICKALAVTKKYKNPLLSINWHTLGYYLNNNLTVHLSITHTNTIATALVLIEKN